LVPFTFKDTGKTVLIRKVSPYLAQEIRKSFPIPMPPVQSVTYPDGTVVQEENRAHPDYIKSLAANEELVNEKLQDLVVARGVVVEITDEIKAEIEALRADMLEIGVELKGSDKAIYIKDLCVGTDSDLMELIEAIMRRSGVTEGATQEALDTFQS
jgi:hypothetical protein